MNQSLLLAGAAAGLMVLLACVAALVLFLVRGAGKVRRYGVIGSALIVLAMIGTSLMTNFIAMPFTRTGQLLSDLITVLMALCEAAGLVGIALAAAADGRRRTR